MTHETDSFIQEVDESLREDRVLAFFRKYGLWLAGAAAIFILGLIGWQVWKGQQMNAARAQSDRFMAAIELARSGNLDGARDEFERLSQSGPRTYRVMAEMERAAVLAEQGDLEAALAAFDAAAEHANDPLMRETAQLRAAYIAAETQDFTALRTRLQPLVDSDSRLSYLAKELLAIEAWEAGDSNLARETLQNLSLAFDAPQSVQQRAQVALSVIGPAPASPSTPADGAPAAPAPSEGETK